ncbi:helix-turn-helix domain-containing protein [Segatella copri]|uniref:helix-turn-helix domain-containing protein n=1 Tax=Segatella copri TaxID=165179 RepID=UPI0029164E43|nr:helix-turn-helix domain-containing protein [Segatella copri]MDV3122488.1 helix-turn-helix domain-containing protein [Segatella copri]
MLGQISLDTILFFLLYGAGTMAALIACLYLMLRRGNAIAPEVTSPVRLRRWTAAFFAVLAIGHLWYLPAAVLTDEDFTVCMLVGGLLDCVTVIPLVTVLLLCMLQDRQRPLWPVGVMTAPLVVLMVAGIVTRSEAYMPMVYGYLLLFGIGLVAYMVHALRQYGRWLRDNFADLEHKEVWHTFVVLAVIVLMLGYYVGGDGSIAYAYIVQVCGIVLIGHLLWRVETLSDLSITQPLTIEIPEDGKTGIEDDGEHQSSDTLSDATFEQIGSLLKKHCADTQLYLQPDLTLPQLASAIGTNRSYLSQYFSRQSITYNTYINNLRINYFVSRCQEAAKAGQPIVAQQLAEESGFSTYRTFSRAFMLRTGQSVSAWMRETGGDCLKTHSSQNVS